MGEVYLNKKPVVEEYEYAYVETSDGAITKVPRNKIYPYVPASEKDVGALSDKLDKEVNQLSNENADLKSDLSEFYTLDSRNLFNGAVFTPNTFYSHIGTLQADNNYSLFELDVEIGKTYIFGNLMRFVVVKENNEIVQGLQDINHFTANGTKAYITGYNNLRDCWIMCENTLEDGVATYDEKVFVGKLKECLDNVERNTNVIDTAFEKNNNLFYGKDYKEGYFFNNFLQESEHYNLFLNVPVIAGVTYVIEPKARILCLLGLPDSKTAIENLTEGDYRTYTPTHNGFLQVSMYAEDNPVSYAFYEKDATNILPFNKLKVSDNVVLPNSITEMNDSLYGKKWAVCGDSFTHGSKSAKFTEGKYTGRNKVYPYFIGNRTGIEVLADFFEGGKTLAYPSDGSFSNSLTCPTYKSFYQNIPVDVDYITIYLGINDSHHERGSSGTDGEEVTGVIPLGTISDNTTSTYYGAWNVVLSWLMKNRPFAHIGIIVSNGCDRVEYRTAQIEIARKYGILFIDMNGDDRTPVMIRSLNPNISAEVKAMVTKKQAVDYDGTKTGSQDWHPSDETHEYESYFIENFLRSL